MNSTGFEDEGVNSFGGLVCEKRDRHLCQVHGVPAVVSPVFHAYSLIRKSATTRLSSRNGCTDADVCGGRTAVVVVLSSLGS